MARYAHGFSLKLAASLLLLLVITGCLFPHNISKDDEIADGKAKSSVVIQSIEQFKLDNGHYPVAMEDLMPKYLTEIPITLTGHQIEYYRDEDFYTVSFMLKRRSKLPEGCGYHRYLDIWECSYGAE
jgi:hypothetical protein